MAGTVWLEERLSVCERLLNVWRWTCTQEVGCVVVVGVWWNVTDILLVLIKFLGEWASLRNRMVLLWACSCPSLPAQLPVR